MSAGLDRDVATLTGWWLEHAVSAPAEVRGLWFGIADLVTAAGKTQRTLHLAGCSEFDPDDGGAWASFPVWEPADRYVSLSGLAALDLEDWSAAVDHLAEVVTRVQPWSSAPEALLGVGVGFDDGDARLVWTRPEPQADQTARNTRSRQSKASKHRFFYVSSLNRDTTPIVEGEIDSVATAEIWRGAPVDSWTTPQMSADKPPLDYLPSLAPLRVCSARLRDVIESERGADDMIQWLHIDLTHADAVHSYFALHFTSYPDVFDPVDTIRVDDFIVRPVIDLAKVGTHRTFGLAGGETRLIVSATVRNAIVSAGCTGVEFSGVRQTDR